MRKSVYLVIAVICLLVILVPVFTACSSRPVNAPVIGSKNDRLVVYNWEDYIDYSNLDSFKSYYKSKNRPRIRYYLYNL